jgi:glycosyltransferase involved in cell wall biosynthesis
VKILLVHNFYQLAGGEDAVVKRELDLLRNMGHDVQLFSVNNDSITGLSDKLKTGALTIYNPFSRRALRDRLRRFKPDIVHVHNFFPRLSPSVFDACRDTATPVVMTLHNFRILCPTSFLYHDDALRERSLNHPSWWTIPRRVYRNSFAGTAVVAAMVEFHKWKRTWQNKVDRFIALTQFAKEKFVEGGLRPERISVKGNSTNIAAVASDGAQRHGALFVGRLSPEKGLWTLIDAWQSIDYPLRIVGDGPLREALLDARPQNVEMVGLLARDDVAVEMQKASFLVIPSLWYEIFPVVLVEAFSNGLPVICSRLGGLSEIVTEKSGLKYTAGDVADLRAKVRQAIAHPESMVRLGWSAREQFAKNWSDGRNYERLMAIYEQTIAECRARS